MIDAINLLKNRGYQRSIASMIYRGSPSYSLDPNNRNKKRWRKEEKGGFYKPKRPPEYIFYELCLGLVTFHSKSDSKRPGPLVTINSFINMAAAPYMH